MGEVYNFIDRNGVCGSEWVHHVSAFTNGFARVKRFDDKMNYINKEGKTLSKEWYKQCRPFSYDGVAIIQRYDNSWNILSTQGKTLSPFWLKETVIFYNGLAVITRGDNKRNIIKVNGELLSKKWFFNVNEHFRDPSFPYALVARDHAEWNVMLPDGSVLFDEWFDFVYPLSDGVFRVRKRERYYYLDTEGKYLFDKGFINSGDYKDGYANVYNSIDNTWYKMDKQGNKTEKL